MNRATLCAKSRRRRPRKASARRQRIILLPSIAWWLGISCTAARGATAANQLTAEQVLAKFAEMQSQVTSFSAEYDFSRQDEEFGSQPRKAAYWLVGETRYDGWRFRERDRLWGQITGNTVRSKDKPYYRSRLCDGQWRYQYHQPFWRVEDIPDERYGTGELILHRMPDRPIELATASFGCQSRLPAA